jgi:hypothetical protein
MAIGSGILKKPKSQLKISCHSSILLYQRPTIKIAVTSITIVNAHSDSFLGKLILLRGIQNFVFCSLEEGLFLRLLSILSSCICLRIFVHIPLHIYHGASSFLALTCPIIIFCQASLSSLPRPTSLSLNRFILLLLL